MLALRFDQGNGTVLALTNLSDQKVQVDVAAEFEPPSRVLEMFANRRYTTTPSQLSDLDLDGFGYRWLRLA